MKAKKNEESVKSTTKIERLTVSFPNEDLNKLVEKINEIIEQ